MPKKPRGVHRTSVPAKLSSSTATTTSTTTTTTNTTTTTTTTPMPTLLKPIMPSIMPTSKPHTRWRAGLHATCMIVASTAVILNLRQTTVSPSWSTLVVSSLLSSTEKYPVKEQTGTQQEDQLERAICINSTTENNVVVQHNRNLPDKVLQQAACRVLVHNTPDYHYELLESVVLKYPLPWDDMPCNFSKSNTVIFELAVAHELGLTKELYGYIDYFRTFVQGTQRQRIVAESKRNHQANTNSSAKEIIQVQQHRRMPNNREDVVAIMGDIMSIGDPILQSRDYAAKIEVSCGYNKEWTVGHERNYCVQHVDCDLDPNHPDFCGKNETPRNCWLNPMHNDTRYGCYFMPDVFPMYPESLCNTDNTNTDLANDGIKPRIRLCTVGASKQHQELAAALQDDLSFYNDNVQVVVLHRHDSLPWQYTAVGMDKKINVSAYNTKSYLLFEKMVSKCHILLPMLLPGNGYFYKVPGEIVSAKKLSGSLSQLVGFSHATVIHEELFESYKSVLKGPVKTFNSLQTFMVALKSMVLDMQNLLPAEMERQCNNPTIVRGKKCLEPDFFLFPPPEPPLETWISAHPLIRQQEEQQLLWERRNRLEANKDDSHKRARADFQLKILQTANSPTNQALQAKAQLLLKEALLNFSKPDHNWTDTKNDPPFNEIIVAVELGGDLMEPGNGRGASIKALVGESMLKQLNGTCVIYGAGVAYESNGFEVKMANRFGCAVHAFDCTMNDEEQLREYIHNQENLSNLAFHPWCVGEEGKVTQELFQNSKTYDYSRAHEAMVSLQTIMEWLGHEEVDLLKFDVEGFEWKLFDNILSSKHLPKQISFELHTRHANMHYVPPHLVAEKGKEAVVKLFDRLYRLGYRVVSKELNFGDYRCAEFVLYQFYSPG